MENLQQDTRAMLERIGAWDNFGASGWPPNNGSIYGGSPTVGHATISLSKLPRYYGSAEIEGLAEAYLARDYESSLLNYSAVLYSKQSTLEENKY